MALQQFRDGVGLNRPLPVQESEKPVTKEAGLDHHRLTIVGQVSDRRSKVFILEMIFPKQLALTFPRIEHFNEKLFVVRNGNAGCELFVLGLKFEGLGAMGARRQAAENEEEGKTGIEKRRLSEAHTPAPWISSNRPVHKANALEHRTADLFNARIACPGGMSAISRGLCEARALPPERGTECS
ncbi:MAG: hypothetical protein AB1813_26490 [Verrucomicrobiota bacterium]